MIITDMETWLRDLGERIYRYGIYKKLFTPYEQRECFTDESLYEDGSYSLCRIVEAIDIGHGDWLLGLQEIFDDGLIFKNIRYVRLSEIRLSYREEDQNLELYEESDEEEK